MAARPIQAWLRAILRPEVEDRPPRLLKALVRDNPDLKFRLTEIGLPNHLPFPVKDPKHSPEGLRILKEINLAEWLKALTYLPTDDIGPPTLAERSA